MPTTRSPFPATVATFAIAMPSGHRDVTGWTFDGSIGVHRTEVNRLYVVTHLGTGMAIWVARTQRGAHGFARDILAGDREIWRVKAPTIADRERMYATLRPIRDAAERERR